MRFCRACALILTLNVGAQPAQARCADLALVLAIDSSGSINTQEFALQVQGYGAAFQNPAVQRALVGAGDVDIAVLYWADADLAFKVIAWQRLSTPQDAEAFASLMLTTPRFADGDTDIGAGLNMALDLFDLPGQCAWRRVVNVSGDGREAQTLPRSPHIPLSQARDRARALGVMVNGLAIVNEDPGLAGYYREQLITGAGSFVMEVKDFRSFGDAVQLKLLREIGVTLSSALDQLRMH